MGARQSGKVTLIELGLLTLFLAVVGVCLQARRIGLSGDEDGKGSDNV